MQNTTDTESCTVNILEKQNMWFGFVNFVMFPTKTL